MEFINNFKYNNFIEHFHMYLLALILFVLHLLAVVSGIVVFFISHLRLSVHILVVGICLFKCIFNCENGKFLLMAVWSLSLHICQEFYIRLAPSWDKKYPRVIAQGVQL